MAAAALMAMGAIAAVSCKKDEVTTGGSTKKVVKGMVQASISTATVTIIGETDSVIRPITDCFDVTFVAAAGEEKQSKQYNGESLSFEVTTTTIPSAGTFNATIAPKDSFKPDTTKRYTFTIKGAKSFSKGYNDGTTRVIKSNVIGSSFNLKGSRWTNDRIQGIAKSMENAIADTCQFED